MADESGKTWIELQIDSIKIGLFKILDIIDHRLINQNPIPIGQKIIQPSWNQWWLCHQLLYWITSNISGWIKI